jgi:hypothetical protein
MKKRQAACGRIAALAVTIGLAASTLPGLAAERPAVIELFTSQGCSSCPPADSLMAQIAHDRRDVIVLSFPVDIWDYIGWKDTLAKPEFTARQRHYSLTRGDHQVYTPQVIVDGATHVVGSDKPQILSMVQKTSAARNGLSAPLTISERDGMVIVDIGAGSGDPGRGAGVWLLRVAASRTVSIGRGENKGRQITYTNVVRSITRMGHWMGVPARFEMPVPEARGEDADGYVVLVQKGWGDTLGPVIAAGKSSNL